VAQSYSVSRTFALATGVLFILACALAARPARADSQIAATVQFSFGAVTVVKPDGNRLPLSRGDSLYEGDTLLTAEDGRVHLRFSDGGFVSLIPQSEFRIESWRYNGELDGSERLGMRLLKGGLRTISGRIGKMSRAAYELATRAATIGIRGTEYTVLYLPDDSVSGTVAEGRIAVCNQGGCLDVPASYSFLATNPQSAPVLTDRAAELGGPLPKEKPKTADTDTSPMPGTKRKTADAEEPARANKPKSDRESSPADKRADKHDVNGDFKDKQKDLADAAVIISPVETVNLIDYDKQATVPVYSPTQPIDSISARVPDISNTGDFSGSGLSVKGVKPDRK
jgi:FecR protein